MSQQKPAQRVELVHYRQPTERGYLVYLGQRRPEKNLAVLGFHHLMRHRGFEFTLYPHRRSTWQGPFPAEHSFSFGRFSGYARWRGPMIEFYLWCANRPVRVEEQ
jgi:hypothetical protein